MVVSRHYASQVVIHPYAQVKRFNRNRGIGSNDRDGLYRTAAGGIRGRQPYSLAGQPRCRDGASLHGAGLVHGRCSRWNGCWLPYGKIPGHGYGLFRGGLHCLNRCRRSGCRCCPGPGSGTGDRCAPGGCQAADDEEGHKEERERPVFHHIAPIWTVILSSCPAILPREAERSGGRSALCSRSR